MKNITIPDKLAVAILMYLDGQVVPNDFARLCGMSMIGVPVSAYCDTYCQTCGIPVDRHVAMDLIRAINMIRTAADTPPKPRKARKSTLAVVKTAPTVN